MSDTNTVSPLRQRMIEDMAARKLNPHTHGARPIGPSHIVGANLRGGLSGLV
jgi:hypothetical protein